ncbi:Lysophosphatidic acid phosphatase type 6 [Sticta canariensis]|nr:Lysophosphatidic acid phosphatase type 6 [Sticta canariensis]
MSCRHGARTPLSPLYWEGSNWSQGSDCGREYDAVRLALTSVSGGPAPPSKHDLKQLQKHCRVALQVSLHQAARGLLKRRIDQSALTLYGCACRLGQQQALSVGKFLRQRYVDKFAFLPPAYQDGVIAGRTTNFRRTVGTLQGMLTGLYPGSQAEVPITTASDEDEILYSNVKSCERLGVLFKARTAMLKEQLSRQPGLEQLQQQVREAMSLPADHAVAFVELHDALTSLRFHGKAIAPGLTPQLLQAIEHEATARMKSAIARRWDHPDSQDDLRLGMGHLVAQQVLHHPLLNLRPHVAQLVDAMVAAEHGQPGPKLQLFSAHDTTVLPILQVLRHDTDKWPPYVANIVFELWQRPPKRWPWSSNQGESFVRVLYNGQPLRLPGSHAGEEA